jgi:hypothetical protein
VGMKRERIEWRKDGRVGRKQYFYTKQADE